MTINLKYGPTNTFYIRGENGGLLIDTGYAGTLPEFYKALKYSNIKIQDINYVMATHYHPDHVGIIGNLINLGIKLLLIDIQKDQVHFSDKIFQRDNILYAPIDDSQATIISCNESRAFLSNLGIFGEIVYTPSHSADSVSLILDNGDCFVGDIEPIEYISAYRDNIELENDWNRILSFRPKKIFYGHAPERNLI